MTIAIDFDDTFTSATDLFRAFITAAKAAGHRVICVSCRTESVENFAEIDDALHPVVLPVYLTSRTAKRWYLRERGVEVDVWVDDRPESVGSGR